MEKERIKNILFVCTGNSCRSIMAEGLLRKALSDKGRNDIQVKSSGMVAVAGLSPIDSTIKVMRKEDIDVTEYKSTALNKELIEEADLILVMDKMHKETVVKMAPSALGKVHLLRRFVKNDEEEDEDFSIPDPIGKPLEVYERVLDMIKEAVGKLAEKIT